ncbi:MAG: ATP-binding protein [Thermodesulfobacteriota bacterium]
MFISIRYKLFATLLAAVVVVVVGMFFLIHWSFDRGFLNYVNTVETKRLDSLAVNLQEAYGDQGDWLFLRENPRLWRQFLAASTPEGHQQFNPLADVIIPREGRGRHHSQGMGNGMRQGRKQPRNIREKMKHLFEFRVVLLDANKNVVIGPRRYPDAEMKIIPLEQGSIPVGYLGHIPQKDLFAQHQLHFVREQKKSFAVISLLIAALAALIGFPLASRLLKRMNALANATHQLAAGKFDTRLEVGPADELGQLTRDFNSLALTLGKNEQGRRQWVADISHELRTPLAVLRGEIEALQDRVRPFTPEAASSLHSEVLRLNRLVDDLFQLSMSDIGALTYRKEQVDVAAVLNRAAELFRPEFTEKDISLTVSAPPEGEMSLFGDPERLQQLFDNLFSNSLKYTDSAGSLKIICQSVAGNTEIIFQDSSPSVPAADIDRLFERLYRVENSRSRASGGAGLGLAICKNIVEAHGGSIVAESSPLGGVLIRITLPAGEQR